MKTIIDEKKKSGDYSIGHMEQSELLLVYEMLFEPQRSKKAVRHASVRQHNDTPVDCLKLFLLLLYTLD